MSVTVVLIISEILMTDAARLNVRDRHKVVWPTLMQVLRNPSYLIAFAFGIGLLRPGSGTWGSLLAAVMWPAMVAWLPEPMLGIFIILAFVLGCVACGQAGRRLGVDDHVGMVWDEMVAVWMLLWALPNNAYAIVIAVILFRVFDVTKPFPIRTVDARVKGGVGVMLDDVLAAVYAWVITFGLLQGMSYFGVGQ